MATKHITFNTAKVVNLL